MEQRTRTNERGELEVYGRVMLGKNGDVPSYRKQVDGKWQHIKKQDVTPEIKELFKVEMSSDGMIMVPDEAQAEVEGGLNLGMDGTAPEFDDSKYIEELEQKSIDNASLADLCKALYERFGIYTSYLKREPKTTDVHPITGALMNNFTLGQSRQQYFGAVRSKTNYDPTVMAQILRSRDTVHFDFQSHREAHPERFAPEGIEMPTEDNPYADKTMTMEEWRKARERANRPIMKSEKGRFDDGTDADEVYAEPPINGATIIRDYPTNPIAERRLREKREQRERYGY